MTDILLDSKEDIKLVDNFISKIKSLKRQFEKENDIFNKKGVLGFNRNPENTFSLMEEISTLYDHMIKNQVIRRISKDKIESVKTEHEKFLEIVSDFEINLKVSERMSNMFIDIAKSNVEAEAQMDIGYNNEAALISKDRMLHNMPSVAVNSKV
jgi:hypothetical protein